LPIVSGAVCLCRQCLDAVLAERLAEVPAGHVIAGSVARRSEPDCDALTT
jgi:hypothetical protein